MKPKNMKASHQSQQLHSTRVKWNFFFAFVCTHFNYCFAKIRMVCLPLSGHWNSSLTMIVIRFSNAKFVFFLTINHVLVVKTDENVYLFFSNSKKSKKNVNCQVKFTFAYIKCLLMSEYRLCHTFWSDDDFQQRQFSRENKCTYWRKREKTFCNVICADVI